MFVVLAKYIVRYPKKIIYKGLKIHMDFVIEESTNGYKLGVF